MNTNTNNNIKELPNFLDKYGRKIIITNYTKELTNFLDEYGVDYKIVETRVVEADAMKKQTKQEKPMECIKTEVKHSLSKHAWNVVGTQLGVKYKIARVPYIAIEGNEILTTRNKHEALEHALFISRCFNEKQ
jgi:hypothetical protein